MPDEEKNTTITVSKENWERLSIIKIEDRLDSIDDVIAKLLKARK